MSGIEAFHFGVYRVQSATASYHVVSTKYAAHNVLDITRYSTEPSFTMDLHHGVETVISRVY